jgi:hypothetical protein
MSRVIDGVKRVALSTKTAACVVGRDDLTKVFDSCVNAHGYLVGLGYLMDLNNELTFNEKWVAYTLDADTGEIVRWYKKR